MARVTHVVVASVLMLCAALGAQEISKEEEKALRDDARRTVLIPFSAAAKTKELKLSSEATKFIDIWFDYCRNKFAARAKPSEQMSGTAHESFEATDSGIKLTIGFVVVTLETAAVPAKELPMLLDTLMAAKCAESVKTDGDDPALLRLWSVMLAENVAAAATASAKKLPFDAKAFDAARNAAAKRILESFDSAEPMREEWEKPGTLRCARAHYLNALIALIGPAAAKDIKRIHQSAVSAGRAVEVRTAAAALIRVGGKESDEFVAAELQSDDKDRIAQALIGVRPGVPVAVLDRIAAILGATSDEGVESLIFSALESAARGPAATRKRAIEILVSAFTGATDDSATKYQSAFALLRAKSDDPQPRAFLTDLCAKLKKDDPSDFRIVAIEEALKAAAASGSSPAPK